MSNQEIPLFSKICELYDKIYDAVKKFPKRDRYALGKRIENCCLNLLELIIEASNSPKDEKMPFLKKANTKLEILKVLLRISNNKKLLTDKDYLDLESILQEAGKMLGGWIRYQNRF